MQFPKVHRRNI